MRAVVQRVQHATVRVEGEIVGAIEAGLCVLVGAAQGDAIADSRYIADKVAHLRIFADSDGKMNRSVIDAAGGVLVVSQFTLLGDARKGRRPAFTGALEPTAAAARVNEVVARLRELGIARVESGRFRATMEVGLVNEGPVTILLDSRRQF